MIPKWGNPAPLHEDEEMTLFDFKTGEFSFTVCPVILTDQGKEMKDRICVAITAMDHKGLVKDSLAMEQVIDRLSIPLFGGPLEGGWYRVDQLEGEAPHIEWNATFHKDRLGVRPDIIDAAVKIPESDDDVNVLFLRMTDEGIIEDDGIEGDS